MFKIKGSAAPALAIAPKSNGRRRIEIAVWSVIVFYLYFEYRLNIRGTLGTLLSDSYQIPLLLTPDYSLGFIPRALSGQLLSFFAAVFSGWRHSSPMPGQAAGAYLLTLHFVTYGIFSVIIGALIEKALSAKNYLLALFPLLIIFTPQAVWFFFFSFNYHDTLLLLFALISIFLVRNEKLMWLAPVCCCLGIMANYSFSLLFFPFVFALLYYEYIKSGMKRSRLANLIVTTASSLAMTIYMLWVPRHIELVCKYSYTKMIEYLEWKAGQSFQCADGWYVSTTVFGKLLDGESGDVFALLNPWSGNVNWFLPKYYVFALLLCAPILLFTLPIWWKHMKGEEGFWKKSPYILFMIAPLLLVPVFRIFMDISRLVYSILLAQVLLVAYIFITDGKNEAFTRLKALGQGKKRWIAFVIFALCIVVPLIVFRGSHWLMPAREVTSDIAAMVG